MRIENVNQYSQCLNRNMNVRIYGHFGVPIVVFPCQDADSYNFENFGMIDTLSDFIESGQIKLYCVDSVDKESVSDLNGDKGHRSYILDQYHYYIVNELLPLIYEDCGGFCMPFTLGCSMGADHAVINFLRRPDLFSGVLALSGVYDLINFFFNGWCDERLYNNAPIEFIKGMRNDHYYIDVYNQRKIFICVGQGNWEEQGIKTLHELENEFNNKNIHSWCDYRGYDVCHDWPWWKIQIRYFLPKLIND